MDNHDIVKNIIKKKNGLSVKQLSVLVPFLKNEFLEILNSIIEKKKLLLKLTKHII